MSEKLLITGAGPSSFLGKHVLKEIEKYPQFNVLAPSSKELNLLNEYEVLKYFYNNKITKIIHLAAQCGGILKNINMPFDMAFDNLKMMVNLFNAVKTYKVNYFCGLGTCCSYPKFAEMPMKESELWNGPSEKSNSPYSESKRMLITLTESYRKQYWFKGVTLIPANLYGEYDHFSLQDSHVIPALIRKFNDAINDGHTTVKCWGTGKATREFLHGADCAEGICKAVAMELDAEMPINLGTCSDISIYDLAHLIGSLMGFKGEIVFTGEVSDGQPKRKLDVTRAKELLNFEAKTSLVDGLKNTIEWYLNNTIKE